MNLVCFVKKILFGEDFITFRKIKKYLVDRDILLLFFALYIFICINTFACKIVQILIFHTYYLIYYFLCF